MKIRTRSGSEYVFTILDNKVYFKKGSIEGVVLAMYGLSVGDNLRIDYLPVRHNIPSEDMSSIETTTIVSIE